MRPTQRLSALLLFAVVSLLALAFSGVMDWITSSLFLVLEFLAEFIRPRLGIGSAGKLRAFARTGAETADSPYGWRHHHRRGTKRRGSPRRPRRGMKEAGNPEPIVAAPEARLMLALDADRPELIEFALEECHARRAELLLLYLRPLAVLPMGPNPLPGLAEDESARALFERVRALGAEAGVPVRTLYELTRDTATTILTFAGEYQADVLVMEASRRNLFSRALAGDAVRAVMTHLPARVSLLIHAA